MSDLHVAYEDNRAIVERLQPRLDGDWLIVAGDVGELLDDIQWVLRTLADRFAKVIWVPGNHELWTMKQETRPLRGVARYEHLVAFCRAHDIVTPEDPFPVWSGAGGDVRIAPLFLLYDYTFLTPGTLTKAESLEAAYTAGVVCNDEFFLFPDPYESREAWCAARVAYSEGRLTEVIKDLPLVLVSHWPLVREPTRVMMYQEFPQWCGTERTADWHTRFGAEVSVYGHLHIPRTTHYDSVRFEEVSIGYPREWRRYGLRDDLVKLVLPGATS